jgi:poly(hydroxyalkanoate) granule-associated protein
MARTKARVRKEPWDSAHKIWLAGLGALSSAEQEGERLFKTLVARGEQYETRVNGTVEKVRSRVGKARDRAGKTLHTIESAFDDRVTSVLGRLGVPTRDEIARLTRKVERLTRVVEGKQPGARKRTKKKKTARKKKARRAARATS